MAATQDAWGKKLVAGALWSVLMHHKTTHCAQTCQEQDPGLAVGQGPPFGGVGIETKRQANVTREKERNKTI